MRVFCWRGACTYPSAARPGNRRRRRRGAALVALLLGTPAAAQYDDASRTRAVIFDPARDPRFGDPRAGLRLLIREHPPRRAGPQHLCVVGYRYRDGSRNAWVHWREGRRLILWEGASAVGPPGAGIGWSRRDLSLRTDVMPDGHFNGSTYMLFAHEVRDILADCARAGRRYALP